MNTRVEFGVIAMDIVVLGRRICPHYIDVNVQKMNSVIDVEFEMDATCAKDDVAINVGVEMDMGFVEVDLHNAMRISRRTITLRSVGTISLGKTSHSF